MRHGNLHKAIRRLDCMVTHGLAWIVAVSCHGWLSAVHRHANVGVQAAQPTGLQAVEEHSAGPAPRPAQRVQPIVQSKQGRGRGRRGQGRQVDSQAEDTDPATDSASQLNAKDQAPKHLSSASEGQPGRSRPPKIPSGPRCVH